MYLNLKGLQDRPIMNTLWTENEESTNLAIFFTGFRYPSEAPLFHFLKLHFLQSRWSVLTLDYRYNENAAFMAQSEEEMDAWFEEEVRIIGNQLETQLSFSRYAFIAKSLGTSFLYKLMENGFSLPYSAQSQLVWLTPGEYNRQICSHIVEHRLPSLIVIGDKDRLYDEQLYYKTSQSMNGEILVIPGAGHILETSGNLNRTMDNNMKAVRFVADRFS